MVVFYLDGTFNCNQDKLYNKRDLRDKSQICTITSQIETICYKNEGKFRTCECLRPALLSQEHDDRMPKLLWIPSTTNCTRAADIQTIQLQPLSLQISVLRWTIGTASLEFPLFSFLWSTIPDIFFLNSARFTVSQASRRITCWWSYARMLITIQINDICFLHVLMKRKLPVDENSKGGGGGGWDYSPK